MKQLTAKLLRILTTVNLYSHLRNHSLSDDDANESVRARKHRRIPTTRTKIKHGKTLPDGARSGIVVTAIGPHWLVSQPDKQHDESEESFVICTVSGTVDAPAGRTLIAVGDNVWFTMSGTSSEVNGIRYPEGVIVRVGVRRTLLSRKAAGKVKREQVLVANVDRLGIVIAAAQPDYHRRLIDRYLIAADKGDLQPFLIVNKLDLVGGELLTAILEDLSVYSDVLGLHVFFVSGKTKHGLKELSDYLVGYTTLFAGQSGVGKSSLINALTDLRLRVGDISAAYQKGKHTTTSAIVVPMRGGGFLVDSPGIREFALWELGLEELPFYFQEFTPYIEDCRFTMCTHTHEPGCAVKQAVESGEIEEGRYISYVLLREEISQS